MNFFFLKNTEVLHVVFNFVEKHGPVFLSLVFVSFSRYNICKKINYYNATYKLVGD